VEFRALASTGDTLFASSLAGALIAYDLQTRRERWRYFDSRNGSAGFLIVVAGGKVFVPYMGAGLVALRASDGREIWRSDPALTGLAWPPAIEGRRVYVSASSGLFAFEN
jgi:outer membrane protein assembly factor BamB